MKFSELPDKIKDWIASDKITYLIMALNEKIRLTGKQEEIIPRLVFNLVTKQFNPLNIKTALLRDLNVDSQKAEWIGAELKDKILKPIEKPLWDIGVDIQHITAGRIPAAQRKTSPAKPEVPPAPAGEATPVIPASTFITPAVKTPPARPVTPSNSVDLREKKITSSQNKKNNHPFILHRERPASPPNKTEIPDKSGAATGSTVNLSRKKTDALKSQVSPKPNPEDKPAPRIVHYSGPVTPVE